MNEEDTKALELRIAATIVTLEGQLIMGGFKPSEAKRAIEAMFDSLRESQSWRRWIGQ